MAFHGILHLPLAPKEAAGYVPSLCFSGEGFCIPPSSVCFWTLTQGENLRSGLTSGATTAMRGLREQEEAELPWVFNFFTINPELPQEQG